MRLVVADSSPLNYLVWIEQVEILPALFERIFVPEVVQNEFASTQGAGEPDYANHPGQTADQRGHGVTPGTLVWHQRPVLAQFAKRLRYPHGRSAGGCADRAAQGALFASKGGGGTVKPLWMAGMITAAITDALARTARMRVPDLLAV